MTVCIITFIIYFQRVRCLPPNPLATADNLGKYKYLSIDNLHCLSGNMLV